MGRRISMIDVTVYHKYLVSLSIISMNKMTPYNDSNSKRYVNVCIWQKCDIL